MDAPCLTFRCPLRWEDLDGAGATRSCDRCRHDVHDLSALGPEGAGALLARAATERICVRFRRSRGGQLLFGAALAAGLVAAPAWAGEGYGSHEPDVRPGEAPISGIRADEEVVMGMLDRSILQETILGAIPRIQEAWSGAASRARGAGGKVVVSLTIGAEGAVTEAHIRSSELGDVDFEAALVGIVKELAFTSPGGGTILVSYPFQFEAIPAD